MNENGELETEEGKIQNQVLSYFNNIFKVEGGPHHVRPIPKGFPYINDLIYLSMCREITKEEVKISLFDISPYKAPGPNGFHTGFYQRGWNIIGDDITEMVKEFTNTGIIQD